jgi:hypothetical protein
VLTLTPTLTLTRSSFSLARTLRDGSPEFAASTHAVHDALVRGAEKQRILPHVVYAHLHGPGGLAEYDARFEDVDELVRNTPTTLVWNELHAYGAPQLSAKPNPSHITIP